MKLKLGNLKSILGGDRTASQEQMTATILFADICGSTRLFEQYGDVQARSTGSRLPASRPLRVFRAQPIWWRRLAAALWPAAKR